MHVCNCTNPPSYGVCNGCGANFGPYPANPYAPAPTPATTTYTLVALPPLTAADVRRIIREELERALEGLRDRSDQV